MPQSHIILFSLPLYVIVVFMVYIIALMRRVYVVINFALVPLRHEQITRILPCVAQGVI